MTTAVDTRLLAVYLNDHLAGATVGVLRVRRMARAYDGTVVGARVAPLVAQFTDERAWLMDCVHRLDLPVRTYKIVGAAVVERLGRLKLNGHVHTGSPLSALLEVELLRGAVTGKSSGWLTLRAQASRLGLAPDQERDLDELVAQAEDQLRALTDLLDVLHANAFRHGGPTTGGGPATA